MDEDEWKLCVDWLVRCELLASDHKVAGPNGQLLEFATLIRDGVLLCHLVNRLSPGCMNNEDFSLRPQMSEFLCLKNIRVFLKTCQKVFGLAEKDLFDPSDLFKSKNFGKVISTLSLLSFSEEAKKSQIEGFSIKSQTDYHPLHTLASHSSDQTSDVYDLRDEVDVIYEDLCSQSRKSSIQGLVPVTKRDYCIKELVETEKNYLEALRMIIDCFIKRLRLKISEEDCQMLFMGVENLFAIHSGFYSDLSKACSSSRSFSYRSSQLTIADCFIKWKEKFLAYGEFCSNLPKVQSILDKLCQNASIHQCIVDCQKDANGGRFRLRDLLSVPMQRVLKYHLLLKELIKNTDQMHPERKSLERALEEMQDLSQYVNEVKRDNENLQWIEEVERSIIDLVMPPGTTLKDYGRLRKDGELRVKRPMEKKERNLMIFLFDKVMLICKIRMRDKLLWGESYNYKDVLVLSQYYCDENVPVTQKDREKMAFLLVDKKTKESSLFVAKTLEVRSKWVEEIAQAHDNVSPPYSLSSQHEFVMNTYLSPTICDVCRKLLKGVFFQGYRCMKTRTNVHKECMKNSKDIAGPPIIPPKKERSLPSTPDPNSTTTQRQGKVRVKAISSYQGLPVPPNGQQVLPFDVNEVFSLVDSSDDHWWKGRKGSLEGCFPKSFVIVMKAVKQSQSCRAELPSSLVPGLPSPRPSLPQPPLTASFSQPRRSLPLPPTPPLRLQSPLSTQPSLLDGDFKSQGSSRASRPGEETPEANDRGEKIMQGIESLNGSLQDLQFVDGKFSSPKMELEKQIWQNKYQVQQPHMKLATGDSSTENNNNVHEPWFMGELSRLEAAKLLDKTPSGTFLVRVSDSGPRRGEYALSIRYGLNNPVKHIKLRKSEEDMYYLVENKMFRGIPELIHFYQTNSLERSFPEVPIPLGIPYLEYTDILEKSSNGHNHDTAAAAADAIVDSTEPRVVGYCLAHLDFLPNEANQISFKAGDRIAIISKAPGQRGFWMGKLNDKVGFFPSELVKEINCTV